MRIFHAYGERRINRNDFVERQIREHYIALELAKLYILHIAVGHLFEVGEQLGVDVPDLASREDALCAFDFVGAKCGIVGLNPRLNHPLGVDVVLHLERQFVELERFCRKRTRGDSGNYDCRYFSHKFSSNFKVRFKYKSNSVKPIFAQLPIFCKPNPTRAE